MRMLLIATLSLFTAGVAQAETVDMSVVTCKDLMAMDDDKAANFLLWMDGYLAGQADVTTIDTDELGSQIDGIAKVCTEKPDISAMSAAKEYLNAE